MSIWHWVTIGTVLASILITFIVPVGMILKRLGFSPWWALAWWLPGVSMLGVWIIALSKWPIDDQRPDQGASSQ